LYEAIMDVCDAVIKAWLSQRTDDAGSLAEMASSFM